MSRPFFHSDRETSKALLFKLIGYEIYQDERSPESAKTVLAFHKSKARELVTGAPARTSKSYSAAPEIVHDFFPDLEERSDGKMVAATHETICWIVAVTYDTVKEWDYAFHYLVDRKLVESLGGKIESAVNSPNQGNMTIKVLWPFATANGAPARSILTVKSSSNEKTLQGEQVKTCIISEAAEHDKRIYEKYLRTRCGRIIFPTTPKRKALWLYEHFQRGIEDKSLSIEYFQFDRFCNPKYDHDGYERAKEIARLTYGDWRDDPDFMEQYEGQWTFSGGKVLPFRWHDDEHGAPSNVVHTLPSWLPTATWAVSMDYGYHDPAVAHWWACSPEGEYLIAAELYESGLGHEDLVRRILKKNEDLGLRPRWYVPDPQRPELTNIMRNLGLPLFNRAAPGVVRDRAAGYQMLRTMLSVDLAIGRPRLRVYRGCEKTISEWKMIRFKDKVSNEFGPNNIEGADHALDSARYFVMSYPKAVQPESRWIDRWNEQQKMLARFKSRTSREYGPLMGGNTRLGAHA